MGTGAPDQNLKVKSELNANPDGISGREDECGLDSSEKMKIGQFGAELIRALRRHNAIWNPRSWPQRFSELILSNTAVKTQLFRWVDVLPTLNTPESIAQQLYAYLNEAGQEISWPIRKTMQVVPVDGGIARIGGRFGKWSTGQMAAQFIAGENPVEAWSAISKLRLRNIAFTADLLGEAVISEAEADVYLETCLELVRELSARLEVEKERPQIDEDDRGPIPRMNLSLKLSSLTSEFDPLDDAGTIERVGARLRRILDEAIRCRAFVHFDMEQFVYKGLTLEIVRRVLMEPAYRQWPHFGFVCQAYLIDSANDLEVMRDWATKRGVPVTVRLVKGAYWDYEVTTAKAAGWPVPVWTEKWQSDANYERLSRFLIENYQVLKPAFASHNARSLSHAIVAAESAGIPRNGIEIQTLYGMGDSLQRVLSSMGFRVRVYTPYGAILPGMAYLVRRLLENTSNDSFLKAAESSRADVEKLLKSPEQGHDMSLLTKVSSWAGMTREAVEARNAKDARKSLEEPFANEPLTDFTIPEYRSKMLECLEKLDRSCGKSRAGMLDWAGLAERGWISSYDPSHRSRLLVRFPRATAQDAALAVGKAQSALDDWRKRVPRERATCLEQAALAMRREKFELAAKIVIEVGKPWKEADADVAEAIDFCRYYSRQMIRMAEGPWRGDVPGETNKLLSEPRGVVAVIGPWNFPLAIPMGMTAAALVTGNVTIMKPAEQSTWIAEDMVRILHESGIPKDVLILLPGDAEAGAALVEDERTAMIVFTGSREVGLKINQTATKQFDGQRQVKKVAAEMGGKNAIIVDEDANLDDAVMGVMASAFGYAGQKCSACSRVIVLAPVYEVFVKRLSEAVKSLTVGPARETSTQVGPLVDAESVRRYQRYSELARLEGQIIAEVDVPELIRETGHFVSPLVVGDLPKGNAILQEEIFAPILAVIRADTFTEAVRIANDVDYSLTGGVYSRNPAHLEQARRDFLVGNLYLNRGCTGALVGRQPFGGLKLSGIGAKTGGPHYLDQFVNFRTVTENTLRRGFTPESLAAHDEF